MTLGMLIDSHAVAHSESPLGGLGGLGAGAGFSVMVMS